MHKITRSDIQHIGDEETLLHFLQEKLNLPISEGATLAQIALPLPLSFLRLDSTVAEYIIDCQDFSGLPQDALGERRPFLIRFRREPGSSEILREVAESLAKRNINPAEVCFICADENFQPFAFAYFNDSTSADWYTAVLTVFSWTRKNTHINAGPEHDISAVLSTQKFSTPPNAPLRGKNTSSHRRGKPNLSKNLLTKLQKTGKSLGRFEGIDIHSGIGLRRKAAFVIDEATSEQLIDKDSSSDKLVETFPDKPERWRWESRNVIYIPSSKNSPWPWSGKTKELEAEQVFKENYPAISARMKQNKNSLKKAKIKVEFYWEFPPAHKYEKLKQPKIIFRANDTSMRAAYNLSCKFLYSATLFIPTTDLSLLAILNSKLFDWYAHKEFKAPDPKSKQLFFTKKNMKTAPIARRTGKQKQELSDLVQQILDAPDSPEVRSIEREIDQLVYKLYKLTGTEITLIEKGYNQ